MDSTIADLNQNEFSISISKAIKKNSTDETSKT